ncbi:hypothetical protein RhiirA4_485089 [Rhizophagus irregularis]|uniref:Uncharacterized protein n=1 Tax=Rhizophagus irregularis TaxID=588596 RepID=A0A2I1HPU9_9GLOM|nr:hypothetical protein RhiirA4_485089 [Rhizophagus irregularis]
MPRLYLEWDVCKHYHAARICKKSLNAENLYDYSQEIKNQLVTYFKNKERIISAENKNKLIYEEDTHKKQDKENKETFLTQQRKTKRTRRQICTYKNNENNLGPSVPDVNLPASNYTSFNIPQDQLAYSYPSIPNDLGQFSYNNHIELSNSYSYSFNQAPDNNFSDNNTFS